MLGDFFVLHDVLSAEECQQYIDFYDSQSKPSLIEGKGKVSDVRRSENSFLELNKLQTDPVLLSITQKLTAAFSEVAYNVFRREIKHIENIQYTKYKEGDYYDWHIDSGHDYASFRDISGTIELSPPEDFEGGELCFFPTENHSTAKQGTLIIFPSTMAHKVKPVTSGIRRSLVVWAGIEDPSVARWDTRNKNDVQRLLWGVDK